MEESVSEVLRCPFCGQVPNRSSRYRDTGGGDGHRRFSVSCENRSCDVMPVVAKFGPSGYGKAGGWLNALSTDELAEKAAIDAWNKRTIEEKR